MAGLGSIGLKVEKHSRKYTEPEHSRKYTEPEHSCKYTEPEHSLKYTEEEHSRKYTEPEHLYVYECRKEITKVSKPVLPLMGITYLSRPAGTGAFVNYIGLGN